MAGQIHLELCAPDHEPVELDVAEVVIPGAAGVFTVLLGHTSLLTTLTRGTVIATNAGGEQEFFAVHEGFAEVKGDKIVILADVLERRSAIDRDRAEAARDRAQALLDKPDEDTSVKRAELALARAIARLQTHSGEEY